MTNLYEIKARAAQLNHPHPTYFSYHAEWAATTILELCDEIERLKAEQMKRRDDIHTCHDQCERIACVQRREIDELKRKLAVAKKALGKYANEETHSMDEHGFTWGGDYFDYETARAALKELE